MPWFQRKRAVAEQQQHRLWRQARMKTNIQLFLSNMSELEVVDSFNAIERHLNGEIEVNDFSFFLFTTTFLFQIIPS